MQHPPKVPLKRRQGGRRLVFVLTGAAATLAALLVLLLPSIRRWFPNGSQTVPSREPTTLLLSQGEVELLDTITVAHLAGDSYTLQYADGALHLLREGQLVDLNDATADELLEAATCLTVENTVSTDASEVAEHLPDMGLSPAQVTVTVRYTDGREDVLEIGASVPETTYSYYRWSGDSGVYMCDAGIGDVFSLTENRLLPIAQPALDKTLIDWVSLKRGAETLELSFTTDASGYTSGALRQPYTYPMNGESTDGVLTALENLRLGATEGAVTPENRAEYGLDAPLCVVTLHQSAGARTAVDEQGQLYSEQLEEQELRFTFGRAHSDYFYTCEYEGNVYLVSRLLVQALIDGQPSEWITTTPANMDGAALSAITVQTGMGSVDIRIVRTERVLPNNQLETDASGAVLYDTAVTLNGQSITTDQLEALVQRLSALTVSGSVPEGWSYGSASPRWQMTLTTSGGTTRTIAAYAMDAFSDALVVDGVMEHYVYIEALATALGEWMPGQS